MYTPATLFTATMVSIGLAGTIALSTSIYFWSNMFRYPGYVPKKKPE